MHGLHQQEAGPRPDLVTQGDVLCCDVDERFWLVGGDRVVDQSVHHAERIDGCGDNPLCAVRVTKISDNRLDAPERLQFRDGCGQLVALDVGQQHRSPALEKRCGDALSDSLRRAGDDSSVTAHRVGVGVAHVTEANRAAGRPANNGKSR